MSEEDSCAKKTCKNSGACCFGFIYDVITCPFISCFKCVRHSCNKCFCGKCCHKHDYTQPK